MSRYPGRLERSLNDSFEYERKLTRRIAELEAQLAHERRKCEAFAERCDHMAKTCRCALYDNEGKEDWLKWADEQAKEATQ